MTAELSRRRMLKGMVAGAVVVGWNPLVRSWVTAADAKTGGLVAIPLLDGTLETGPGVVGDFASDFGHLVSRSPVAVLRPGSVDDVVKMVRYARRHGLKVAMNGQSGTPDKRESHSNYGQALVEAGVAIDAKSLSTIHGISGMTADVDAGVTWASLFTAAAAEGKTPAVLTDFLHLSIGGTLSVGGVGGTIQKFGTQADTVVELLVVTGDGRLRTCSATQRADLFNAVLAGAGQCGLILRAKIKLVPAMTNARIFNLFYDDLATFVADQLKLMKDGRFTYQEGQIVRKADDSGWRYMIEVGSYYTPPTVPDQTALLAGLSDDRPSAVIFDLPYAQWVFRLDPVAAALKGAGFWDQPHPWVSVSVPASRAVDFISTVVAQLSPPDLGAGLALLFPMKTSKITRPLFALPHPSEPAAFQLSLLRFPFPGYPGIPGMVAQNRVFFDEAVQRGGKRYIIGAIPDMTAQDWRRNFAPHWDFFAAAKDDFDPDRVLTPGQGIFT